MRAGRGWVIAFAACLVLTMAGTAVLFVVSAGMQVEVDAYYTRIGCCDTAVEIDPQQDAYYNGLSLLGGDLNGAGRGLLLVAACGGFLLLALLAHRRDVAGSSDQAEATAAS